MNNHWHDLIQRYISGTITDAEAAALEQQLKTDATLRDWYLDAVNLDSALELTAESAEVALSLPVPPSQRALAPAASQPFRWLSWRPLTAAAAGIVFGMFCTSVLFAYTQPKPPILVTKMLPLTDADFESGSQVPAQGIPARAGAWSGDFSRVAAAENRIKPKQGRRMLRFLRSDNELSSKNRHSYVGSVAQVIDLRPLRAELSGAEQLVEVSAQFDSIAMPPGANYEFAVKAAAYRGDIADAPRLWEDREASGSRSDRSVVADSDAATWQRVALPLVVPPEADFLVIECAVVFKGAQAAQGVAEFPGHYVDQVEVRLNGSVNAWAVAHNAN